MTATGPKHTSANLPMPSGLAKVLRPCDQRLISQAPAKAASVVPSAIDPASTSGRTSHDAGRNHMRDKTPGEDRRPDAIAAQQNDAERDAGRRP